MVASSSRRAGGLFNSVKSLAKALVDSDVDVSVFSAIDSFSKIDSSTWDQINVVTKRVIGPHFWGWQPELRNSLNRFKPQVIHANGLWMYFFFAAYRVATAKCVPFVVSPRGMLDHWALSNSGWKKRLILKLYARKALETAACIHVLNDAELKNIRRLNIKTPVAIIPNGSDFAGFDMLPERKPIWRVEHNIDGNILLFLGRLHPKKGLDRLIPAFDKFVNMTDGNRWNLVIAGEADKAYKNWIPAILKTISPIGRSSIFCIGGCYGPEKINTLRSANGFILPSVSEGMPMAVLEAWACKVPVLMTPECNIDEAFENSAALKIGHTEADILAGLIAFASLSTLDRIRMGRSGRDLVESHHRWDVIAQSMRDVYGWVSGECSRPSCVRVVD